MIEIITHNVEMPKLLDRRFQKDVLKNNQRRWVVIDTLYNKVIFQGSYEKASLISHNFNKKFYDKNS